MTYITILFFIGKYFCFKIYGKVLRIFSQKPLLLVALTIFTVAAGIFIVNKPEVYLDESEETLGSLIEGNERFNQMKPLHPHQSKALIQQLSERGQHPKAIVISCSDSRVPPELIFDQGVGDLFVIRTAGNIIGEFELGSIEYALEHLKTRLIVVMGHKHCGAIDAWMQHRGEHIGGHSQFILDYIENEDEEQEIIEEGVLDSEHAVVANVKHGINILRSDNSIIKELYQTGELQMIGAVYDLETGKVQIIER